MEFVFPARHTVASATLPITVPAAVNGHGPDDTNEPAGKSFYQANEPEHEALCKGMQQQDALSVLGSLPSKWQALHPTSQSNSLIRATP